MKSRCYNIHAGLYGSSYACSSSVQLLCLCQVSWRQLLPAFITAKGKPMVMKEPPITKKTLSIWSWQGLLKSERFTCRARLIDKAACVRSSNKWFVSQWNNILKYNLYTLSVLCAVLTMWLGPTAKALQREEQKEVRGNRVPTFSSILVNYSKAFCLFLLHLLVVWQATMATTLNQYTYQRLMRNMPQFAYDHNLCGLTSKAQKHTNWINHQPRHTVSKAFTCTPVALNSNDCWQCLH